MLLSRWQDLPNVQIPHIKRLGFFLATVETTVQHIDRSTGIPAEEERNRVAALAGLVAHTMDSGVELAGGLTLEVLEATPWSAETLESLLCNCFAVFEFWRVDVADVDGRDGCETPLSIITFGDLAVCCLRARVEVDGLCVCQRTTAALHAQMVWFLPHRHSLMA